MVDYQRIYSPSYVFSASAPPFTSAASKPCASFKKSLSALQKISKSDYDRNGNDQAFTASFYGIGVGVNSNIPLPILNLVLPLFILGGALTNVFVFLREVLMKKIIHDLYAFFYSYNLFVHS